MSKKLPTVNLTILNKEYKIACPLEDQASLIQTAHLLDDKMRHLHNSGKVNGIDRVAVMAALNLAHELEMARPEYSASADADDSFVERINQMRQKIENALKN